MWTDNETDVDYLNFSGVAETVAELIAQANSRRISIGIAGASGVGKSSMIQLSLDDLSLRVRNIAAGHCNTPSSANVTCGTYAFTNEGNSAGE